MIMEKSFSTNDNNRNFMKVKKSLKSSYLRNGIFFSLISHKKVTIRNDDMNNLNSKFEINQTQNSRNSLGNPSLQSSEMDDIFEQIEEGKEGIDDLRLSGLPDFSLLTKSYMSIESSHGISSNKSLFSLQSQGKKSFISKNIFRSSIDKMVICRHPKILIVDDEEFNILGMQLLLSKKNIKADSAKNGEEAIEKIKNDYNRRKFCSCKQYSIIFMDVNMPVINGYEATKVLKNLMRKNEIPQIFIIACTAYDSPSEKLNCKLSGMDDYLSKPIQYNQLNDMIDKYFKIKF